MENIDVGLFLNLIESFPHLYNLKDKNYKNILMKENSWREISIAMETTVEDCKRLWKNLRDRFTKEKRLIPSGSGASQSSWEYFRSMMFYENCIVKRRTISTTKKIPIQSPEIPVDSCSSQDADIWDSMQVIIQENTEDPSSSSTVQDENTEERVKHTEQKQKKSDHPCKGKKRAKEDSEFSEMVDIAKTIATKIAKTSNSRNHTFAQYIQQTLYEMDEEDAKQMRRKIVSVLES